MTKEDQGSYGQEAEKAASFAVLREQVHKDIKLEKEEHKREKIDLLNAQSSFPILTLDEGAFVTLYQ